ncbi:MAG: beta-lactamase family protein [Acidobacteria bacterium]|nr:beta-lactamase family protein [Acidobacteriota bacterium]
MAIFLMIATSPMLTASALAAPVSMSQIDAIFAGLTSNGAPGAAVLVIQEGKTVFARGYGIANLRTNEKISPRTNFRLASLTKQFTAMSVLLLAHDGKLRLDEPLTEIFPDFPAYGKTITVRHLLNHTSGLLDYEDLMPAPHAKEMFQIKDAGVLAILEKQKTAKFPPGTKWEYSNSGYAVLAMIVEKVSGEPFGRFLQERIFAPLHMNGTLAYEKGKNKVPQRAFGYSPENGRWRETDQSPTSAVLGDGGVYSSLEDLAKWDAALREHALLSGSEFRAATTPVQAPGVDGPDHRPAEYGFGWFLNPYQGHTRMWHYGETVGFRTAIQRFPKDGITVVVLSNRADADAIRLSLKVADLFLVP